MDFYFDADIVGADILTVSFAGSQTPPQLIGMIHRHRKQVQPVDGYTRPLHVAGRYYAPAFTPSAQSQFPQR